MNTYNTFLIDKHADQLDRTCSWCGKTCQYETIWQASQIRYDAQPGDFIIYREACKDHIGLLQMWVYGWIYRMKGDENE